MKIWIAFLLFVFQYATASAITACDLKWRAKMEMNVISSNVANINTTRTPSGGPYERQILVCEETEIGCNVETIGNVVMKYEPEHPDASNSGMVAYPDINLVEELSDMIAALEQYESAAESCPDSEPFQPPHLHF